MGCSPKRFSRPPRCDRFDTPPCPSIISVFYAPVNRLIRARSCFVLRRAFILFSALFYRRRYAATLLPALCCLSCLYPIFCPLLLSLICRNVFTRALPLAATFPYSPLAFYCRHMPRCFRLRCAFARSCQLFAFRAVTYGAFMLLFA